MTKRVNRQPTARAVQYYLAMNLVLASLCALVPSEAFAKPGDHTLRLQGATGLLMTEPDYGDFQVGGGGSFSYEFKLMPMAGIEARVSYFRFPPEMGESGDRASLLPALALRIHPLPDIEWADIWLSLGGGPAFSGEDIHPGIEASIGLEIDILWWLRLGPFVRYTHLLNLEALDGVSNQVQAGYLQFGLSFAFLGEEVLPPTVDWEAQGRDLPLETWHEAVPVERACSEDEDCPGAATCAERTLRSCSNCPRGENARICVGGE